ncbi:MAG TPA: ATP-binding cassette domain-containing protein [Cyclobacteriaceae bacterium]|nr:ATP-binding cassette domain-containing protein [Cyclobacteriaceae bacterium]
MSDKLLKAILRLFALLASVDGISEFERKSIRAFLEARLNHDSVLKYLDFLGAVENEYQRLSSGDITNLEKEAVNSEILRIANEINLELAHQQKIVLMLDLVTLMVADNVIDEQELHIVNTIGKAIRVDQSDIDDLTAFAGAAKMQDFDHESFLIIADKKENLPEKARYFKSSILEGFLTVLSLKKTNNLYFIKYIGHSNIYLNNTLLRPGIIEMVTVGSAIRATNLNPIYYSDIINSFRPEGSSVRISFIAENIEYKFHGGKLGLRDVTIREEDGSLVGLMGSSGAGKSTLLNILNGNEKPSGGKVLINGIDIHKEKRKTEGIIGYVPQDDLLMEDLTVYQNLYYAAKLCFNNLSEIEIDSLVSRTLSNLGLNDTRELKVGSPLDKKISGGQRKRLNIGLELLREPMVMFVDEPTSGLSSRDSENIMDLLKELTLRGKLIFVVIHQPSSDIFKMFDKLVILDVGGYQIFYGNPLEAAIYFKQIFELVDSEQGACINCGNVNVEQIFNIIESRIVNEFGRLTRERKITPSQWYAFFKEKIKIPDITAISERLTSTLNIPGKLAQFKIFSVRDFLSKTSNTQYLVINLLEAPLLAFLLAFIIRFFPESESTGGYMFSSNVNIPAYIFMSVIVALFMGLTVSAEEILRDRKILKRESFLNLSRGSYIASKLFILFSLSAIQTLSFVLLANYILEVKGMLLPFWLILFSASCFANILGLNISSSFNSAVTVYILIPILLIPQLILSGVVVKFDELNPQITSRSRVPFIGDVMASRWAFEAAMVTQFRKNRFERNFYDLDRRMGNSEYKNLYFIPALSSRLDQAYNSLKSNNPGETKEAEKNLELLRKEISRELIEFGSQHFPEYELLNPGDFNHDIYKKCTDFLAVLKKVYINRYNDALSRKEQMIALLTDSPVKRAAYDRLKNDYMNERVEEMVKNSSEALRIIEHNGRLVQKIYPVFLEIDNNGNLLDFRTVFYAPEKNFMGRKADTLWFNTAFIWFMTVVLVFTLYFDALRKIIKGSGKLISFKKK